MLCDGNWIAHVAKISMHLTFYNFNKYKNDLKMIHLLKLRIFGSFGLSTKEPYTVMNWPLCVIIIGVSIGGVSISICAHLCLAQG